MVHKTTLFKCIVILSAAFALSCSDNNSDDDPEPDPTPNPEDCRVVTYRCESRNETWRIVYNAAGSYDSILVGDQQNVDVVRTFDYDFTDPSNVKVTVNRYFQGDPSDGPSTVEISGATGRINFIQDEQYVGEHWDKVSFSYRNDNPALVDKSAETMFGGDQSYESYYQWETVAPAPAINMTKLTTPSGVYTYIYYNQPTQPGDYLNFEKVIAAYDKYYRPFSSSQLLKSIEMDGEPLVDVTYSFDGEGKITSFTVDYDGGSPEKWDLTYECE